KTGSQLRQPKISTGNDDQSIVCIADDIIPFVFIGKTQDLIECDVPQNGTKHGTLWNPSLHISSTRLSLSRYRIVLFAKYESSILHMYGG
ncbi:hypothetical protein RF55_12779, partial [Lasius niger]